MKFKIARVVGFYPNDKNTGQPNEDKYGIYTAIWLLIKGQDGVFTGKARANSPMLSFKTGDEVDLVITGEKQVGDKKYVNFRLVGGADKQESPSLPSNSPVQPVSAPSGVDARFGQIEAEIGGLRKRIEDLENVAGEETPF